MRKFFTILIVSILLLSFIGSLYIIPTYNKQSQNITERFQSVFFPNSVKQKATEKYLLNRKSALESNRLNNLSLLDSDAHQYSLTNYCKANGHNVVTDEESGLITCEYTEQSCEGQNNLVTTYNEEIGENIYDPVKSKYFEWHNGKCLKSFPMAKGICDMKFGLSYYKGDIKCDPIGVLDFTKCEIQKNPSCYISKDYCSSKGLEHTDSNGGLGDCYNPLWQEILENLLGTTLTRKYKQSINEMVNQCKNSPLSSDCGNSILNFQKTGPVVLKDTAFKFFPERWKELLDTCGNVSTQGDTSENLSNCILAYLKFDPVTYLAVTMGKVLNKLVCEMLVDKIGDTDPIVAGTCDLTGKAIKALFYATDKTIEYLIKYGAIIGPAIAESITNLGELLEDEFRQIGTDFENLSVKMLNMFDAVGDFVLDIPGFSEKIELFLDYHPVLLCVNSILYGNLDLLEVYIDLFDQGKIQDIIQYSSIVTTSFEQGGQELGKFITTTLITDGLDAITNTGEILVTAFGESATLFLDTSAEVSTFFSEDLGGQLTNVGEGIANTVTNTAENIGDALQDGANAAGGFFVDVVDSCSIM